MNSKQNFLNAGQSKNEAELFQLLQSDGPGIAAAIAKNPNATESILEKLMSHSSLIVRHEVAKNRQTPVRVLEKLILDKDMLVRDYAKRNLKRLNTNL